MVLFPAIDILGSKAVRLFKGDYNQVTVYSENPIEVARTFADKGCKAIHLVDLDGAKEGSAVNMKTIEKIAQISSLYSEIGGGIRNMSTVERYLEVGIGRVILGTAALNDPAFLKDAIKRFGCRIAVGVDMKEGYVAIKGWLETSKKKGLVFLKELEDLGLKAAIVTDISRDGAMKGTNLELYRSIASTVGLQITASGGVSTLDDIKALKEIGVHAAIIGKAYYTGAIRLEEALEVAS